MRLSFDGKPPGPFIHYVVDGFLTMTEPKPWSSLLSICLCWTKCLAESTVSYSLKSPTKGLSEFEILDDETLRVSIPVKTSKTDPTPWYRLFLFKYGTWLAGLHVYLNVRKVDFFQHHPFAVASLPESGKITLVIKRETGLQRNCTIRSKQCATNNSTAKLPKPTPTLLN